MHKKTWKISLGVVALSLAAVPALAAADAWTPLFTVDGLDNGDGSASTTLAVSSASGDFTGSALNPHGCTLTGYAIMNSSLGATAKDLNNRVLLAAFLAGKQVRLYMDGSHCINNGVVTTGTTGSPTFSLVNVRQ